MYYCRAGGRHKRGRWFSNPFDKEPFTRVLQRSSAIFPAVGIKKSNQVKSARANMELNLQLLFLDVGDLSPNSSESITAKRQLFPVQGSWFIGAAIIVAIFRRLIRALAVVGSVRLVVYPLLFNHLLSLGKLSILSAICDYRRATQACGGWISASRDNGMTR